MKKNFILSLLIVLLLFMISGLTFTFFKFSGTGTKVNVISTGIISVVYNEETNINLTSLYPMDDVVGNNLTTADNGVLKFKIIANLSENATINYSFYFNNILFSSNGVTPTLNADYIKFSLYKKIGSGELMPVLNRINILMRDFMETVPIDSGTFTDNGTIEYVLKAWVSNNYSLPIANSTNQSGIHSNETRSENLTFKIKVIANA